MSTDTGGIPVLAHSIISDSKSQKRHDGNDGRRLRAEMPGRGESRHGPIMLFLRGALLLIYFWGSCFTLAATQYCGAPLYWINKDRYYRFMAFTKEGMCLLMTTVTQWWSPTIIKVSGDESVKDQIRMTADGTVEYSFPERLLLIANHQLYSDWLYLWWTAYANWRKVHGYIYIVLKEEVRYLPLIGPGLMFAGFIFMSRNFKRDQPRLAHRTAQLRRRGPEGLAPMWLMMFPEGTNLGKNGRRKSLAWAKKQGVPDFRHALIPRSTGTYLCLKALEGTIEYVYDCTLAYDGIPEGEYGQDVFTLSSNYFQGRPPVVNMHWRSFKMSEIPLDSPEAFAEWVRERWVEKDDLLEYFTVKGCFPSALKDGQIFTEIRTQHWWEVWKIFGVVAVVGGLAVGARSVWQAVV